MATLPLNRMKAGPGPMEIETHPEANGESFEEGQFVYLVSGLVTEVASNGAVILGMAQHDAAGVDNADVAVLLANANQRFRMSCGESSAAAIAATDVGVKFAVRVANNRTYCDPSDTDNDALVIRKVLFDAIAVGDLNPEVEATVLYAAFQGGGAAT